MIDENQAINLLPKQLQAVRMTLLQGKTWRYLRYLHAREALLACSDVESVLVVGAGNGLAEIALALEFPQIRFKLTDWQGATHQIEKSKSLSRDLGLSNVSFSTLDILSPDADLVADMVYSVEVLEHIEDDVLSAAYMKSLARRYVFCLVPFAEEELNLDARRRARVLQITGHYVVGYNVARLITLFPNPVRIRGVYWQEHGLQLRRLLTELSPVEIKQRAPELMSMATADIKEDIPVAMTEAQGIWWLARS